VEAEMTRRDKPTGSDEASSVSWVGIGSFYMIWAAMGFGWALFNGTWLTVGIWFGVITIGTVAAAIYSRID
jgi:hypothetical protein